MKPSKPEPAKMRPIKDPEPLGKTEEKKNTRRAKIAREWDKVVKDSF